MTKEEADRLKAIMKERDDDNGGEPLNAVDRGYHLACTHFYEEIDMLIETQDKYTQSVKPKTDMTRDIEEIKEILETDCNSDKKCEMISKIVNGKPHYFKEPKGKQVKYIKADVLDNIRAEIEQIGGDDEKAFCKNLNESYKQGLKDALKVIDKCRQEG